MHEYAALESGPRPAPEPGEGSRAEAAPPAPAGGRFDLASVLTSGGGASPRDGRPLDVQVQRLMGFEAELSTPITTPKSGKKLKDGVRLATHVGPDARKGAEPEFKLVTDARLKSHAEGQDEKDKYSIVEFVTTATEVVGENQGPGLEKMLRMVDEMEALDSTFVAKGGALGDFSSKRLSVEKQYKGTKFAPDLEGYTKSDELGMHYSVGVPLAGVGSLFDKLVKHNTKHGHMKDLQYSTAVRRLRQSKDFADDVLALYTQKQAKEEQSGDESAVQAEARALHGYCRLAYTQVAAAADALWADHLYASGKSKEESGLIKNWTAVLSRASLAEAREGFSEDVQTFLAAEQESIFGLMTKLWRGRGRYQKDFLGDTEAGDQFTLAQYAESALKGDSPGGQQRVFGGMSTYKPNVEEGVTMVPMEIRYLGSLDKTWKSVRADLKTVAGWAQKSFEAARPPESKDSKLEKPPEPMDQAVDSEEKQPTLGPEPKKRRTDKTQT